MDGEGMDGKAFGLKRKWTERKCMEKEMCGKENGLVLEEYF